MENNEKQETFAILGVKEKDLRLLLKTIKESGNCKKSDYYLFLHAIRMAANPIQISVDLLDTQE